MSKNLEPCPFCGSKYIGVIVPIEKGYQVQCGDCYASSSVESTEKKAIKAWNRRAATEANEPLTLDRMAKEYLEICGEDCAGDSSVGLPSCPFYNFPDVDASGELLPGGCQLAVYRRPPEECGG